MKKFTFKTEKATGKYRSFEPDRHVVKYNKKECGTIHDGEPYTIRLQVMKNKEEAEKSNCPWKWIKLKKESKSLQEAKDYLNTMVEKIHSTFTLFLNDD